MRALVVGESHSHAIAEAVAADPVRYRGIKVRRLTRKRGFNQDSTPLEEAVRMAGALRPEVPLFLSMLGTYANILGLLSAGADYDFALTPADASESDHRPVALLPHRAVSGAFSEHIGNAHSLKKIRYATRSSVFLLSPPPPKQSNDYIMQKFMLQQNRRYRGRHVSVGVTRPELRLKLWKLEVELLKELAEREGMEFVPAPSEALNEDGFLARKYYAQDATHANSRYGSLVAEQICQLHRRVRKELASG